MANDKNLKGVYETLKREGYTPPAFDEFVKDMQDDENLRGVHSTLTKSGYTPPSYEQFKIDMLGNAPVASTPQPKQGKPVQSQSAPQTPTPATETTAPQQTTQPHVSTPAPAPQPTWQPTEQDKIRMAYNLNSMMSDFNARSKARIAQSRRVAERNTPEGRRKLKAAKFQAQLAGTPTQVMGLTPDVSASPSGNSQAERDEQAKPLLSGQGPVPYGVIEVDGQRKTQWLLPDGSLTTDFMEADKAEYGARRVRLMNQFVGRMKENGLDPSKQEDVQRQAQLDYEAPIRKAVATALQADDERSDKEQEDYMSNPLNMVGGVNAALGHAAARKQAGIGDLSRIADEAYEALPSSYRQELIASYADYFTKHPEDTNGKTIEQAAKDAAKSVVYGQVHEEYVKRNGPQSKNEFFVRKVLELNPASVALSGTINPYGQAYAELDAMERYGKEHRGLDIAGMIAGMAIDPTTYLGGWAGKTAFNYATRGVGKMMAKRALGDVAGRYAATTLAGRIFGSMAAGGANFGTFDAVKDAERQLYQGGYLNPETGEMEGFSFGSVLNSGVHGIRMGAATGVISPLIGNVADKAVKATTSTAGKVAMRGTEVLASTLAEGTVFSIPEWISGDQDAFDVWTDNMAMMAGFKLSHAIKSAPAMIRSLRPVKPTGDRPLSREERIHNNKSFSELIRERLDQSPSDLAMSKEEREELRRKGYGELSDLFAYDPEHKSRKVASQEAEGDYTGTTGLSRTVDYEPTLDETGNPAFDGYEVMESLMEDESVSEATRAKAYYILTGHMLPMSTVTGWSMDEGEDGTIYISSINQQGGIVTSRKFSNKEAADREIERINRQTELNTIDIGEQYRNAEAQQRVMEAAIREVSPGADPRAVYEIYERVKRGDKDVTEDQRTLADFIDEAIERNTDAGAEVSPAGIRERISQETGVDIDRAIRKEPGKRTEDEQEAVKRYVRELFPEPETYEPTPEEAEADRIYEDSRLLYGRFEQGDPEAQAEIDAISLRMTEAHQLCEDAFGDEAETYMWQIKDDPWGTLNDPELTPDQKEAVLYYINAKAALDGVLDASNEAAADKRQKVQSEVAHRTHKERGVIVPATMKADDRPVYIIKGEVAMFPDGSGVDVSNSSNDVIILDESGEYKFTSPDQILTVGETIDPQTELQTAYEAIDREQEAIISAATEGVPESPESVPNSSNPVETTQETVEDDGFIPIDPALVPNFDEAMAELAAGTAEAETAPASSEPKPSAISQIPTNEKGDPIYEQVDADLAWDGLLEETEDEQIAQNVIAQEIAEREDALKKLEKQKPKAGLSTREKIKAEKDKKQAMDDIRSSIDHWKRMATTKQRRQAEEDSKRVEEARRHAEERRAQAERERAEREAAERREREALNGVPDWRKDTGEAARARGFRMVDGERVDRQGEEDMSVPEGREKSQVRVKFDNKNLVEGVMTVIEASELQPSHLNWRDNPRFMIPEAQPKTEFDSDRISSVEYMAENMNPEEITGGVTAFTGAPVVNRRKESIQGTGRSNGLRIMWESHPERAEAYREYLIELAKRGLVNKTPEEIMAMRQPVNVRMLDVDDAEAIRLGNISVDSTESGGHKRIEAQSTSSSLAANKRMGEFFRRLFEGTDEDMSLTECIRENGYSLLGWMADMGVITNTQYKSALTNLNNKSVDLTEDSVSDIRKIVELSFFEGAPAGLKDAWRIVPDKAQRAILATSYRDYDSEPDMRIRDELHHGVEAFAEMSSYPGFAEATNIKDALAGAELWASQYFFGENGETLLNREKYSNFALHIAALFKGLTQKELRRQFNEFYDLVQEKHKLNLEDMMEGKTEADFARPANLEAGVKAVFGIDYEHKSNNRYGKDTEQDRGVSLAGNSEAGATGNRVGPGGIDGREREPGGGWTADSGRGASNDSGAGTGSVEEDRRAGFLDAVRTLYEKGKEAASRLFGRSFFDVVKTPDFMKDLGLSGDRFTIRYGVISRHFGKDAEHDLPLELWERLPEALSEPFAITKYYTDKERKHQKGYRLYTSLRMPNGSYVVVSAEVKNAGRNLEVNAINTIFGRNSLSEAQDELIYTSKKITPEQQSLLDGNNPHQYPAGRESLEDKQGIRAESSLGERISSGKSKSGKSYEIVVASDETRDGVRKVKFETCVDKGKRASVQNSLLLPLSFIESDNRAFEVVQGHVDLNIAGVIVDASGAVSAEMADGSIIAVNDLPAGIPEKLGIKVRGEHREDRLSDAEVVEYEAHIGGLLEQYVNNGWRKKKIHKQLRSETEALKEVYLSAGYTAEEAESKAEQLIEGIIEKLTPKQVGEFTVYIENERGSLRSGVNEDGNIWETEMKNDYGFIPGVKSTDGDNLDVFLSSDIDDWNGRKVFVVDQYKPDGSFDEHKVMLGFNDRDEAFEAYLSNYEDGWEKGRRLECTEVNLEDFERWIDSSKRKTKPFADYKSVKAITEDVDQTRTNINNEGIVTDGDGKPLTLYHGTPNKSVTSVSQLEPGHTRMGEEAPVRYNGDGVSFTPEFSVAQDYAADAGNRKGRIFPANIRLQNPYYTLGVAHFTPEEAAEFTAGLKAKGHDGIINYASKAMREDGALPNEVIVFDNSAILPIEDNDLDGLDYTITPTEYQGKKKKTPVWVVKFDRDLSDEEKAALDTYIREPLAEGKKTSRGWYDRKEGGYMMRSEEAAKGLARMLDNPEAVADAQPLSAEDYKETIAPAAKEGRAPAKAGDSKKVATPAPMNRVDVGGLFNDLSTKGETKLSNHSAPVKTESAPAKPEPKRMIVDDEMRGMEDQLRSLLGIDDSEGDRGDLFRNPEDFTNKERMQITSLGITYALKYFDQGIVSFPDFADRMVRRMGEKIRPWLKAFYGGARDIPGYEHLPFTPADEVKAFDVMNFDKENKDADPMRTAQGIVAESRAEAAVTEAKKEITEQRNQKRKENDRQREADTEAIADEGGAIASEAERLAEASEDEAELNHASEKIDEALEKVNDQLALLGYYEAERVEKDFNEALGYMRNAEKKALADAVKLAKQLVKDLGIEIDKVTGSTTAKKSKKPTAVSANIAPAGGDISIRLPLNEGRELYVSISLDPSVERGDVTYSGDNLQATSIMYRVENPAASGYDRFGRNCWADASTTYSDLLKAIQRESYKYLPEANAEGKEYKSGDSIQYSADGGKSWTDGKVVELNHDGSLKLDTGLAPVLYVNATQEQVRRKEGLAKAEPSKKEPEKPQYPDPKDKEAVSYWLADNSAAIWEGVDAITKDAKADTGLRNTFKAANDDSIKEADLSDFVERWLADRIEDMMELHPATVKAWYDYDQQGIILSTIAGRIEDALAKEAKKDRENETVNGYKRGDEVLWDRYGKGQWEKQIISDFDEAGRPILDSFGQNWITEVADWERIKPVEGKEPKQEIPAETPESATEKAIETLTGKKRPVRKTEVKPKQVVGDLFGGLFDEPAKNEKETELQTRPGTGERAEGHEPRQDEPVGTSQRNEDGGTDGRGMAGRSGSDTGSDSGRGSAVSPIPSEHAVSQEKRDEPLTRLPQKQRRNRNNHVIKRGSEIAPASVDARIRANIEAIETMKRLTSTGADATAEDMAKMRAFSGWGGLGKAFSDYHLSRRLRQLLGEEAFAEDAQMSRNSAYFTPGYVVDAMWDVAKGLGFSGGNVLEGSAGIGNIIGLMPPELSDRSAIQAVEKDTTTGSMLSLLYPDAKVDVQGFEETKIQNGSIDLAITNVPFVPGLRVKDTTGDHDLSKRFKDIHNFCIAKNVRKLRDGGIGIFITTKGTLDSAGGLYSWLTNEGNADIVGLFRLHNETFGGTDATSDIIVVRKRVNGQKSEHAIDASATTGVRTADYDDGKKTVTRSLSYNRYFVEHPEHMAGEMKFGFETGNTYRPTSVALHPVKGKDQARMLKAWVKEMSKKTFEEPEAVTEPTNHREEYVPTYDKAGVEVKTGSMQVDSKGRICVNYDGVLRPLMSDLDKKNPKSEEERIAQFNKNKVKGRTRPQVIADYNEIKKALNELLDYQKNNESDEGLQKYIDNLNAAYDRFVGYYGHLHRNPSISLLKNDVDFPSVLALETYREEGIDHTPVFGKADIFRGRVMAKMEQPKPQSIKDGVILSIRQTGDLNMDYIAEALGKTIDEVKKDIIKQGLGYENPTTHIMEPAHLYLSGNVREKLRLAEANNENGRYDANISALRRIVPPTVPSHMIEFSIGSSWLNPQLFNEYIKERTDLNVSMTYAAGTWTMQIDGDSIPEKDKSFGVQSDLCDKIIPGHELILAAMTNKTIRVSKTQKDDKTIFDPAATQVCASKVDEIRDDFRSWLRSRMQQDEKLATEIEEKYNDTFNNSAPIEIPNEYVPERFEGAATVVNGKPLKLRPHQAKAVVRGTMQSLMLAHEVGTGKTYTLITTAMEMRRLGTAKKPMIVVQNSTLGQFVASAKALYPDARILSLEDKDRNAQGRKDFYAKIRYNDWDMVVIPQSVLEKIDDHPDRKRKFIEDTIAEKLDVISQLSEDRENGRMVANMKKEVEKLRDDLAELHAKEEKKKKKDEKKEAIKKANAKIKAQEMLERETDDNLNFDDLGIDAILVDEAHEYKHLGFATAMQRGVKGVDPSFSKKCQGLFLKVKAIQERSGGRNVVFATGTPISNTAAEIWTFMRYLMPKEEMEAYNIWYFDDFVRNFGSIQQMLEYGTSGTYKEVNRFAGYNNLPEMARLWAGITDTVKTDEAGEVKKHIPALEGGQPTDIHLPQTSALRSVLKYVRQRLKDFEAMTGQEKKENSHIPLVMYGIAKAAAVDARLVSASAPDDPHSKTNEAVRQTLRSLKDTAKYNGTVAIFADNYQRKNKQTDKVEFNLFEDIKKKLIKSGVPESQIWIMNSGMSAKKKEDIFARVNSGEIRVIMGTTPLLGVGVNIQERLHTLMHLDAPNRPMDYWQRMGRLLRQGNLHKEMDIPVRVLRFGVEDSLDVTAYQRLKTKGAIADAVMNSKALLSNNLENRVLEEEGDEFGQITAELSGSEYAILQNQTEKELRKLIAKEENHRQHQTYIYYKIPEYKRKIEETEARIEALDETIAMLEALPKEKTISINGKKYKGTASMEQLFKDDNKTLGELIERAENLGTESKHVVRFTIEGKMPGEIERTVSQQMVNTVGDMAVIVDTYVTIPGITTHRSLKSRWLKSNINEILELINPERFKRVREREANDLAAYQRNIETLSKDRGKPFEHTARIAELRQLLEEYTLKLQEDLAAKEKKYAEMDKEVADLDDITFTAEDDEEEEEETKKQKGRELSRLVSEGNSLDFLDAQGHRSAYRYAQFVPGGLTKYGTGYVREGVRPPMTAIDSETQDWRAPMVFNEWEQSVEGMRKDNGKADLVQGNGRTTGNVAYNPYFHIRVHPLNDQFSAAYDRPELVVVEGDYPESELTSGYRAEGAKNSVGLTDWHAGSVNGQLSPGKKVQTVLSRYFKPRRIVPWSEVAERIMDHIAGEDVTFPLNVVPPRLRAELSKRGAKFHGISGSVSKDQRAHLEDVERELAAGNHDFGVEGGLSDSDIAEYNQRIDRLSSTDPNTMEGAVTLLSDKLNTPIRVISRKEAEAEGYRRKKGWYDRETGQITVVADNHRNVGDIADTTVHEAVGHHGLRQLFGTEEKLNNFLDEAYNISNDRIKAEIDRRTEKMMEDEISRIQERKRLEREARGENPDSHYYEDLSDAKMEAEKQREQIRRDATEEYAADLGMKIGEEGFERMDAEEQTFWGKLKGMLQKALDRLLAGLKLPKMRAWTDKEWSYVLWKSWRNLREGNRRSFFTEAEDIVRREKSNFGASESRLFRDGDLGLEEAITKMKADAAAANGADFKAKQEAMRAIGGNLSNLRRAMARQREYDITTVKSMTDLSKILLDAGLLDDLSKYETKRILSAIKDAVGREDTSKQVQRLMDIMVDNQLRMGANYFGRLLSVKGSRVDARGIEVQGELDPEGQKIAQTVKKATTRTLEDIENMMAEAINRMSSTDQAVADEAALEYAGLQIAHQYAEEIRESKSEERDLAASIKDAQEEYKQGNMTRDAYLQYKAATEEAIRQNKIERAEAYRSLSEQLGGVLGESVERAKQWREAEKQRVEEIHHNANSDMEGRPTNEHHKADRLQKFVNNGILRFLLAPLGTFDQMLRMFGSKSVRGEGYLWNRYMRGWVDCTEKEYTGYQEVLKTLDKKVSEVFGKDMKWGDLFAMERRMPKASVRFWDGGEMRDHELTQGNLLYIYMTDKMTDGRMKLRRMGIKEEDVERIKDFVDPRFIELADWMQEEYLTEKRNGYNEVHKRMFGTSMAAIENYFPLKILANARMEDVDVAEPEAGSQVLPATSTGSIIKRKRNNLALDVTGADAFSVILDHIQQMERWAAFAEYNRDLNTLLSYKRFRNQVMNMTSAYGAGKTLWTNFRNVAAMAAGAYRPPIAPLDKAAVNVAKGVTAAKVSFRMFTALKQFLSMPAYVSDSNPIHLAANIANPYKAWTWSMENLPLFEKRWKSRMAGDPRLLKSDMDWKMWRSRIVEVAGRVGMSPNAFVDALTVAIGARSMYQTKLAKYKRYGYTPEQARKRALQDATILFNQTQQSSENAFLSTMQVDRSWLSVLFSVFRNSSMSYTRQLYDAMRNIGHRLTPGYKGLTEEFMAKQMRRDGIDPDQADRNAKQEYRRGLIRDIVRIGVFGYALQFAWNLGAYLPYLIFGKNADEKDKMWDDVLNHSMFGSVEGLTGGDVMSAAGEMWMNGEGNPEQLTKDMPLASDVVSILRKMDKDYVSAMNDVVNLLVQSGLGFNPQSLTDAAVAVMDYCGGDAQTSRECALLIARIINCPQSQIDKMYFDEIDATGEEASTMTPEEIAERYAEYKMNRNAPLTGWAYDEEGRKNVMEKQRKKAKKAMKERMTSTAANQRTRELLEGFDEVSEREKELNRLKKSDREAYHRGRKELREGTDMRRHNRVKRYNHDIKRLTEKWMNAKTPQDADSIAGAMLNARERMLIDVDSIEAQ